jgi:DNA-binding transcriptional LysR family regulator
LPVPGQDAGDVMFAQEIETYLAVIDTGSLSKAAERLSVTQTTVSKRLKSLEEQMGLTLIERGKGVRQIRMTPAGEAFCKLAEQWSLLTKEANILKSQGPTLALTIAAVDSLNVFIFPSLYQLLHSEQPLLKLEIRTLHSEEMYAMVENRQIDVAFTLRERSHNNVDVQAFFSTPMVVLSYSAKPGTRETVVQPHALDPEHELYIRWSTRFEAWHNRLWDPLLPSRIRLDSAHLLFSLLREPRQWAIVPRWVADAAKLRGSYQVRRLASQPPDYVCYKLTHQQPTTFTQKALSVFDGYAGHIQEWVKQV